MEDARACGRDWELGDGEERHREHPHSFFIPSREVRSGLEPGDAVRLLFVVTDPGDNRPTAERMWVKVTDRTASGYAGFLDNTPVAIDDLSRGDLIAFAPRHVIAVDDPEWDRYAGLSAFVSRRLIENDDLAPEFVVHDPSDLELEPRGGIRPSGWQLLVGDETDEELADPANVRAPNLSWLMERYPAFGELVLSGATDGSWVLAAHPSGYRPEPPPA